MSHGSARIFTDNSILQGIHSDLMNGSESKLKYADLTDRVIGVFYDVYNELGHGFLESTYSAAMLVALEEHGFQASREAPIPVWFRSRKVGQYFADLIVEDRIILELKASRTIEPAHEAQLLHYLRATEIEVGLLLNFGLRPQFRRLLFDNDRKRSVKIRVNPWR